MLRQPAPSPERSPQPQACGAPALRPRVSHADAALVSRRLHSAGATAGVSGAVRETLGAVIALLPGWKRICDDQVRLAHLVALCPSQHHKRTIGRALAALDRVEIIRYTPAQGRATNATITVHPRLLDGVTELARDGAGRVVVPFSGPRPYINQNLYPPTPQTQTRKLAPTRPIGVKVDSQELRAVLANMAEPFQTLPRPLRWQLGRAIRDKLARGWRASDLLTVLNAPTPPVVQRPLRLARWRLTQNLVGAGPRLVPLQRAWDQAASADQQRQQTAEHQRSYQRIAAITSAADRSAMVDAITRMFGGSPDPQRAVITAARRAQREHPTASLKAAIAAWLHARPDGPQQRATDTPEARRRPAEPSWLATSGECVMCGQPGFERRELPLQSVVCDSCWTVEMVS